MGFMCAISAPDPVHKTAPTRVSVVWRACVQAPALLCVEPQKKKDTYMNSNEHVDVEFVKVETKPTAAAAKSAIKEIGSLVIGLAVFILMIPVAVVQSFFKKRPVVGKVAKYTAIWIVIVTAIGILSQGDLGSGVRYNAAVAASAAIDGRYSHAGEYAWRTLTLAPKPGVMTRAANALF